MKKFEINKTYSDGFLTDNNDMCTTLYKCIKRSDKFVTFEDQHGKIKRTKIYNFNLSAETVSFQGAYFSA